MAAAAKAESSFVTVGDALVASSSQPASPGSPRDSKAGGEPVAASSNARVSQRRRSLSARGFRDYKQTAAAQTGESTVVAANRKRLARDTRFGHAIGAVLSAVRVMGQAFAPEDGVTQLIGAAEDPRLARQRMMTDEELRWARANNRLRQAARMGPLAVPQDAGFVPPDPHSRRAVVSIKSARALPSGASSWRRRAGMDSGLGLIRAKSSRDWSVDMGDNENGPNATIAEEDEGPPQQRQHPMPAAFRRISVGADGADAAMTAITGTAGAAELIAAARAARAQLQQQEEASGRGAVPPPLQHHDSAPKLRTERVERSATRRASVEEALRMVVSESDGPSRGADGVDDGTRLEDMSDTSADEDANRSDVSSAAQRSRGGDAAMQELSAAVGSAVVSRVSRRRVQHAPDSRRQLQHAPDSRRRVQHAPDSRRRVQHSPDSRRQLQHSPASRRRVGQDDRQRSESRNRRHSTTGSSPRGRRGSRIAEALQPVGSAISKAGRAFLEGDRQEWSQKQREMRAMSSERDLSGAVSGRSRRHPHARGHRASDTALEAWTADASLAPAAAAAARVGGARWVVDASAPHRSTEAAAAAAVAASKQSGWAEDDSLDAQWRRALPSSAGDADDNDHEQHREAVAATAAVVDGSGGRALKSALRSSKREGDGFAGVVAGDDQAALREEYRRNEEAGWWADGEADEQVDWGVLCCPCCPSLWGAQARARAAAQRAQAQAAHAAAKQRHNSHRGATVVPLAEPKN